MADKDIGMLAKSYNDGVAAARRVVNDMSTAYQKDFPFADEDLIRGILKQIDTLPKK
jgi:hypothetical protein